MESSSASDRICVAAGLQQAKVMAVFYRRRE
jgi:hypothetical protein